MWSLLSTTIAAAIQFRDIVSGLKPPAGRPVWKGRSGEGVAPLRKLGIIGGASWSSTALYYDHLNRGIAQRLGGLHSARLIIESLDFEDYAAFHRDDDLEGGNALIVDAAKRLKAAGAEALLLASNTMHRAHAEVFAATRLPLIDIREATAERLVIHRQTLGYRLRKIEGLTGRSMKSSADIADFWMALITRRISSVRD